MKTYQNEKNFVENFAKDAKESLKNGQNFEATVNNAVIVVSGMDNNNASKVTMYTATINGVAFSGSITALKKRLNITYTKEYNRNSEASTKVTIKSDEELAATAKVAAERYIKAAVLIAEYNKRYNIPEGTTEIEAVILDSLKQARDKAAAEKEAAAQKKAEEAANKLANEKAKLEKQLAELQAKLAKMQ